MATDGLVGGFAFEGISALKVNPIVKKSKKEFLKSSLVVG